MSGRLVFGHGIATRPYRKGRTRNRPLVILLARTRGMISGVYVRVGAHWWLVYAKGRNGSHRTHRAGES